MSLAEELAEKWACRINRWLQDGGDPADGDKIVECINEALERAALECKHDEIPMDKGESATANACAARIRALKSK